MNSYGKQNQDTKNSRYVLVNGQKIYLTKPQQQAYDKMINDVRHLSLSSE